MEYSQYNIYLNNFPQAEYTTIYNLFTKNIGCYLTKLLFPLPDESLYNSLHKKQFWIDTKTKEMLAVEDTYLKTITDSKKLSLMIILTGECNCKCCYCYEGNENTLPNTFISQEKIIDFVEQYYVENSFNELEVVFYGGEPLLNKSVISQLSRTFHERYSNSFHFSLITNGTLLDDKDLLIWKQYGLNLLKITIDGSQKSHDYRRPYKSGKGTYTDILNNLSKVPYDVEIRINTVIDEDVFGFCELLDDIKNRDIDAKYSINLKEPCMLNLEKKAAMVIQYASILKDRNLFQYTKLSTAHGCLCQRKLLNYFVIDGCGNIYSCNGKFFVIGQLGQPLERTVYKYREECQTCKYLPVCYGDCCYDTVCQKEYFDYLFPQLLKVYISKS